MIPRMEHVARRYGAWVTMATFGAWAEATGQHGFREHIARIFHDTNDAVRVTKLLPRISKDWNAPSSSRFDRYLPWVAREFDRIYIPWKNIAEREGLPDVPTGYDFGRRTFVRVPETFQDYAMELGQLGRDTRVLQDAFLSIVNWATDEHIDLNRYTWDEAMKEALAWSEARELASLSQGYIVYRFADGWTIQKLRTQEQLDSEADIMQNCLDQYEAGSPVTSYDGSKVWIFSLRDPKGRSHATLEWDLENAYVSQLRGKQNMEPAPEYLERLICFRIDYLDPLLSQHGFTSISTPSGFDIFGKTPLVGSYSVRCPGKENDVFVVYESESRGLASAFSQAQVDGAIESLQHTFDRTAESIVFPYDLPDDERDAWEEEAMREHWNDLAAEASIDELANEKLVPWSIPWFVWRASHLILEDAEDEMMEWIARQPGLSCRNHGKPVASKAELTALPEP